MCLTRPGSISLPWLPNRWCHTNFSHHGDTRMVMAMSCATSSKRPQTGRGEADGSAESNSGGCTGQIRVNCAAVGGGTAARERDPHMGKLVWNTATGIRGMKQNAKCMKKFCLAELSQVELLINATSRLVTHISSEITYVGMKQYVYVWNRLSQVWNDMCRYETIYIGMIAGNNMCAYKTIPIGMKQVFKGIK